MRLSHVIFITVSVLCIASPVLSEESPSEKPKTEFANGYQRGFSVTSMFRDLDDNTEKSVVSNCESDAPLEPASQRKTKLQHKIDTYNHNQTKRKGEWSSKDYYTTFGTKRVDFNLPKKVECHSAKAVE